MSRILIAGGGIAGLTAAVALQRRGVDAHVYEAAPALHAVGAGIWVPPNAMAVLERLDLAEAVTRAGVELERGEVADLYGGVLNTIDMAELRSSSGHGTVALRRSALQDALAAGLAPHTLHLGRRVVAFEESGGGVTARFDDGGAEAGTLLIGADGIRSTVRERLFPGAPLRYSGQSCHRGLAPLRLPEPVRTVGREIWGGTVRFGYSEVADGVVYWFAPVTAPGGERDEPGLVERLARRYAAFPDPVVRIIEATPESAIVRTDLWDLRPLRAWHRGRVGLIGDAAHAATPNLGQGGAQAIEDALSLALHIEEHGPTPAAFEAMRRARHGRVVRIVRLSRLFGQLAHLENALARRLRNLALTSTPETVQKRQAQELFTPRL